MSLPKIVLDHALSWSQNSFFDYETRKEIEFLINSKNEKELINRFYRDLEFGTGGMRGIMGAGTALFNVYNVRRASEALALYLQKIHGNKGLKIALSYDSRFHSRRFAEVACEVFAYNGISCLLTQDMRPVPMLSFMVRQYQCDAGVCITASHNPAQYNGYKIYWSSGGQLCPPHDAHILKYYNECKDYSSIKFSVFSEAKKQQKIREISSELDKAYFDKLKTVSLFQGNRNLKIVYSSLHGTGIHILPDALKIFGFEDLTIVDEQAVPDGRFPTVVSPNPEERKSLEMALDLGKKVNADVVLATDPDADRLGVVVREDKEWKLFTGNQMGALLFDFVLSNLKKQNKLPLYSLTIKTVVTSDLLLAISKHYGVHCEETLTGFKWICNLTEDYESGNLKPYKQFICGAEESYGFLMGTFVRDKDAVLSSLVVCEMIAYYKSLNKHLSEALSDLYKVHGLYHEHLESLTLPGKDGEEKIRQIMKDYRANPPHKLGEYVVLKVVDYLNTQETKLPKSDVLEYLVRGGRVTLRPSGTEPKIKIYISVFADAQTTNMNYLKTEENLELMAKELLSSFMNKMKH